MDKICPLYKAAYIQGVFANPNATTEQLDKLSRAKQKFWKANVNNCDGEKCVLFVPFGESGSCGLINSTHP